MKVVLYTSEGCQNCVDWKAKLKQNNIEFEERNIGVDEIRRELYMKQRCTTPSLFVDGRLVEDIDEWLKILHSEG